MFVNTKDNNNFINEDDAFMARYMAGRFSINQTVRGALAPFEMARLEQIMSQGLAHPI